MNSKAFFFLWPRCSARWRVGDTAVGEASRCPLPQNSSTLPSGDQECGIPGFRDFKLFSLAFRLCYGTASQVTEPWNESLLLACAHHQKSFDGVVRPLADALSSSCCRSQNESMEGSRFSSKYRPRQILWNTHLIISCMDSGFADFIDFTDTVILLVRLLMVMC